MSYTDSYDLPEMIVRPEDVSPPPPITYGPDQLTELKRKLAEQLAKQLAEEEDQTGQRSQLRDVFNSDSEFGLGNTEPPPTPSSQPLKITVTPDTLTNVPAGPSYGPASTGPDLTQDQPNLEGTIPDLTGTFDTPPTPSSQSLVSHIDQATRGVRQMARGALSTAGSLPWMAAAGVAAIPGAISELVGQPAPNSREAVNWLMGRAEASRRFAEDVTGLSGDAAEPQNPVETVAKIIGESATPIKGASLAATGIVAGVNSLFSPAEAKTKDEKATAKQQARTRGETIVETIGGPAEVSNRELYTLGGIAAGAIGMIFGPRIYRTFKSGAVPKLRPVEDAAPGTQAMSTNIDLARTADDANAGALRVLQRAGVNPTALQETQKAFEIQTRANAHALVDSAITMGRMDTPNFIFRSKMPVAEIAKRETPELVEYLHLRDTFDDIMAIQNSPRAMRNAQQASPGPVRVRGLDENQVLAQVTALERAHPDLKQLGALYRDNTKAMRKFMSDGEYATLSKGRARQLNSEHANTVPVQGERQLGTAYDRGSPTESLATTMHRELRERMENEAKGQFVDAMRKAQPGTFVRVTPEQLKANPRWKKNTVDIYRRGRKESYTTDPFLADVLRMDPYAITGQFGQIAYSTKRLLEMGATGKLAPWFSVTSALRSWQIGKYTTAGNRNAPTALGTLYAIPQQLVPQLSGTIAGSLERGSGQWLTKVFGQSAVSNMSTRLAQAYSDSIVAQLARAGTTQSSIMEHQVIAMTKLQHATNAATGSARAILSAYDSLLHAIHNAPMHNYASRNLKGTIGQRLRGKAPQNNTVDIAAEARHMTGSPKVGGSFLTRHQFGAPARPIRMEGTNRVTHKVVKGYGFLNEAGRQSIPWFNITQQGIKRIGEAYVTNPARFVGRMWLYASMPAAASYYLARGLDKDPNGLSYVDYMMNRRSEYAKQMFLYIPLPGRPAEEGIVFPLFHELAPVARLSTVALDHMARSSMFKESEEFIKAAAGLLNADKATPEQASVRDRVLSRGVFTEGQDVAHAGRAFVDTAITPPMPPIVNIALSQFGIVGPQGAFGGDAYARKQDPFDQTGGMPANLDILARATAGGIADVVGSGYAAYTQTPKGFTDGLLNASKEMGRRMITKTPLVRDLTNMRMPMTGNNAITEQLFKKQKAIDNLVRFNQRYGIDGIRQINTKPASVSGGAIVDKLLGPSMPAEAVGLNQPKPTNSLYVEFIDRLRNFAKKDALENEGYGFRSMWRRYGDATSQLQGMRNINAGNYVTWQAAMEGRPKQVEELKKNNVDVNNPQAVRNFYEKQRQDAGRVILRAIMAVEEEFSKAKGKPIKIEDLDPYKKDEVVGENTGILPDPILDMQMNQF